VRDTPVPESPIELERLRVAAALQRARRALVARPRPHALDLSQGAVMPVLHALGVDIFDLEIFRLAGEPELARAVYRLQCPGGPVRIEVGSAESGPPSENATADRHTLSLISNGRNWRARTGDRSRAIDLDLFDEFFAEALNVLLSAEGDAGARFDRAAELLRSRDRGGNDRPPLERITLAEVREYAEQVRHLRGKLEARFAGEPIEMSSRSAFYFVLAALALHHGRADAIPADDLVRPPDEPPASRRSRELGRPGWHLLLDHQPEALEERTRVLLDALQLRNMFSVTKRGEPYPAGG
jgi:hypothetical protein